MGVPHQTGDPADHSDSFGRRDHGRAVMHRVLPVQQPAQILGHGGAVGRDGRDEGGGFTVVLAAR
jgi:hypothetical protein